MSPGLGIWHVLRLLSPQQWFEFRRMLIYGFVVLLILVALVDHGGKSTRKDKKCKASMGGMKCDFWKEDVFCIKCCMALLRLVDH